MSFITTEIKSYDCADHDPIDTWIPDDRAVVDFWCTVAIGIQDEEGADYFQVHVVTQRALSQVSDKKYILVVPYYDNWNQIIRLIDEKMKSCKDVSWAGFTEQFSRVFAWEYEGYKRT
jgi:hypothetical protein